MIERTIRSLLDDKPLAETSLPRAGRMTVRRQPALGRDVVHLMMATPVLRGELRGDNVQPIQDFVELRDVTVDLCVPGRGQPGRRTPATLAQAAPDIPVRPRFRVRTEGRALEAHDAHLTSRP